MCLKSNIDERIKFKKFCVQQKTQITYSFINICLQTYFFGEIFVQVFLNDILFQIMIQFK